MDGGIRALKATGMEERISTTFSGRPFWMLPYPKKYAGRNTSTNSFTVWKQGKAKEGEVRGKRLYLESTTEVGVMGHCSSTGKMSSRHFPRKDSCSMDELFRDHHRPNKTKGADGKVSVLHHEKALR